MLTSNTLSSTVSQCAVCVSFGVCNYQPTNHIWCNCMSNWQSFPSHWLSLDTNTLDVEDDLLSQQINAKNSTDILRLNIYNHPITKLSTYKAYIKFKINVYLYPFFFFIYIYLFVTRTDLPTPQRLISGDFFFSPPPPMH